MINVQDILSGLGANQSLTSEERLACQTAAARLHQLQVDLTDTRIAEKHLRAEVETIAYCPIGEIASIYVERAADLLDDLYGFDRLQKHAREGGYVIP